jgi:hypothetical protein
VAEESNHHVRRRAAIHSRRIKVGLVVVRLRQERERFDRTGDRVNTCTRSGLTCSF